MESISSLVISLLLDNSSFKKGMDESSKSVKNMGETAKKTGEQISHDLGSAFIDVVKKAFPLIGVAATVNALANAQQNLYSVQRASKETGIPANEYAAWGRAAENLGFKAEDAQGALANLQEQLNQAALTGRSDAAGVLTYLGVSLFKANGQLKSSTDVLKDLSGVLAKMPIERARVYGQMMGISPSTVALLREGKDLTKELAEQLKTGPTNEQAEVAWETQKAWNAMLQTGGDLARELFVMVAPAVIKLLEALRSIVSVLAQNFELVAWGAGILALAANFGKLTAAMTFAGKAGAAALTLLGAAAKANPLLLIISSILGALYSLSAWFKGESSVVGEFFDMLGVKAESVKAIFETLGKLISAAFAPFAFVINGLGALFSQEQNAEMAKNLTGQIGKDAQMVSQPPSITNANNNARVVNSQVQNNVTVNANNNAESIKNATMKGVAGGMSGFDRSLTTFVQSGFESA
nr:MAG TPA: tail tape measure [Caudoviricetes sp.]